MESGSPALTSSTASLFAIACGLAILISRKKNNSAVGQQKRFKKEDTHRKIKSNVKAGQGNWNL
jgi:hypothetical protein